MSEPADDPTVRAAVGGVAADDSRGPQPALGKVRAVGLRVRSLGEDGTATAATDD